MTNVEVSRCTPGIPNIVQAHRLFGEPDYQLYIAAKSKQHFQEIYDTQLTQLIKEHIRSKLT